MSRLLAALVLATGLALATGTARAEVLVADLSRHLIAITAAFDGTEVLLFGNVEEADDVVVVVHGPSEDLTVRRKARTLGVWLNVQSVEFRAVPSYYAVAATQPLAELLEPAVRARHMLGIDQLVLQPEGAVDATVATSFREGLIRNKQRERLYPLKPALVRFVGGGLFRTSIWFPANVRPGRYRVEVFSVRDGAVVAAQQSALIVTKVGVEARLSEFAREDAQLYGVGAIVFAVAAGWAAAAAFRRS